MDDEERDCVNGKGKKWIREKWKRNNGRKGKERKECGKWRDSVLRKK